MVNIMSKNYLLPLLILCSVFLSATPALAAIPGTENLFEFNDNFSKLALEKWLPLISKYALSLLYVTSIIALAIGYKDILLSGGAQLEGTIALFVRLAFLTGMMAWLLNNPLLFTYIPKSLDQLGGYIATGKAGELSYTKISGAFAGILDPIFKYYETLRWYNSAAIIIVCIVLIFFINCLAVLFLSALILVRIETMFILIGGMFTASFFVLGYFRDIFMGYIKALAMNGVKLLLLSLCVGFLADFIEGWNVSSWDIDHPIIIYNTIIPMAFTLMTFYIIVKSVPQYAVAILTGHASADGSIAKAAAMAAIGTAANVWNMSSQSIKNTGSAVHNAYQAVKSFGETKDAYRADGAGSLVSNTMGAMSFLKTATFGYDNNNGNGKNTSSGKNTSDSGNTNSANNEMKPGGSFDAFKSKDSYSNREGG